MTYLLCVRESVEKHPILSSILSFFFTKNKKINVIDIRQVMSLRSLISASNDSKFVVTDPIVGFVIGFVFRKKLTFFSLEMFEFQVSNKDIRSIIRNFIFSICHRYTLSKASCIFFPNVCRYKYYSDKYPEINRKSYIVPNYPSRNVLNVIDTIRGKSPTRNEALVKSGMNAEMLSELDKKIIYIYAGTLNDEARGLNKIMDYFSKKTNAILLLAGVDKTGNLQKNILHKNCIYLGELARNNVMELLMTSDFGILFYDRLLLNTEYCAPVKIFEYVNCGLNIVASKNEGLIEYSQIISQYIVEEDDELDMHSNDEYSPESLNQFINKNYEDCLNSMFRD